MPLIHNADLVLNRERERLAQTQARQAAASDDETFSGQVLHDDKSPETAVKSTGFGPHIEAAREARALAPKGKEPSPRTDSHDTVVP